MLFIFSSTCELSLAVVLSHEGDPIIIVSGGDQSLLNMRNIQEFLEKGQYVSLSKHISISVLGGMDSYVHGCLVNTFLLLYLR